MHTRTCMQARTAPSVGLPLSSVVSGLKLQGPVSFEPEGERHREVPAKGEGWLRGRGLVRSGHLDLGRANSTQVGLTPVTL